MRGQRHDRDQDDVAQEWDAFYRSEGADDRAWSGEPNPTLVAEVVDLAPGTALDVGCGEGGDAIWLARRGWDVVAVDPSRIAIQRAEAAAEAAGQEVAWVVSGLLELPDGIGPFDLVTAHYAVVRDTPDRAAVRRLVDAVAPGGTLLVVHHELDATPDAGHGGEHGADHDPDHDPGHADLLMPADVRRHLDDRWVIEVDDVRPRSAAIPSAQRHVRDLVVKARRPATSAIASGASGPAERDSGTTRRGKLRDLR